MSADGEAPQRSTVGIAWRVGLLVLLALGVVVTARGLSTTATDRDEKEEELDAVQTRVGELTATAGLLAEENEELEREADQAGVALKPAAVAALVATRDRLRDAACQAGRDAASDGTENPATEDIITFVTSGAENDHQVLADLSRWERLVNTDGLAERMEACEAQEVAAIEAEAAAIEEAEQQANRDACAANEIIACTSLSQGELEALCAQGAQEACTQLAAGFTTDEVEQKIAGAYCRWRSDGTGYHFNLDTGEEIFNLDPNFNPCG